MKFGASLVVCVALLGWCGIVDAGELEFFAGSASKPATQELAEAFRKETGHKVRVHFGSSGNLLSQMKIAKRGDLYFPGSPDYMRIAEREGAVAPGTARIVTYLVPSINVQKGNPKGIRGLEDLGREDVRVAIGNPHHVCVGLYAVEIFERNNVLELVRPRILGYTESCAKTANILALNGADAILGWRVFQWWNPEKIETVMVRPEQIPRISYMPIAIASYSKNRELAQLFIDFACSDTGKRIFEKWGYLTREEQARKHAPNALIGGDYELPEGW